MLHNIGRLFPSLRWSGTELTVTEASTDIQVLYQTRMMMGDDECRAVGGILGRGNRSTRRKPAPVPLCPPQIPNDLTRALEVGSRRLTT
jgi:hypothetical protein